jgi:hypothetical protein
MSSSPPCPVCCGPHLSHIQVSYIVSFTPWPPQVCIISIVCWFRQGHQGRKLTCSLEPHNKKIHRQLLLHPCIIYNINYFVSDYKWQLAGAFLSISGIYHVSRDQSPCPLFACYPRVVLLHLLYYCFKIFVFAALVCVCLSNLAQELLDSLEGLRICDLILTVAWYDGPGRLSTWESCCFSVLAIAPEWNCRTSSSLGHPASDDVLWCHSN